MARQRKSGGGNVNDISDKNPNTNHSSSSNGSIASKTIRKPNWHTYLKITIGSICLTIAATVGYVGYLETRVNTPYDEEKMVVRTGTDVPDKYWGSYRPGTYFGLKTRDPHSLVTGLMWYFPSRLSPGGEGIRHWCEQSDNLKKYGWLQHDGLNFGIQEIEDGLFLLTTSFVKRVGGEHGGDWTARITVSAKNPSAQNEEASLIWYTAIEDKTGGFIKPSGAANKLITGVRGETPGLGGFDIKIYNHSGIIKHESYLSTIAPGLHKLKETVMSSLRLRKDPVSMQKSIVLAGELLHGPGGQKLEPNFVASQVTVSLPFTLDVVFESKSNKFRQESLVGSAYTSELEWNKNRFEERFEETFHLKTKWNKAEVKFAQAALSNMLGGIGYFYGASRVVSEYTKEAVPYWKAPLFTAVPSRSFFPRGFLWDEGFHGLLIAAWDLDLELDIINHWFDLMNVEGWIPREQILGIEALSKVPEEFVTQRNTNANPPTFFLTLRYILQRYPEQLLEPNRYENLERLYPRLQSWFAWFNNTQRGNLPGAYRWRGRDPKAVRELNPKTLTSGLDDYPRASHPNEDERHVDLRCWIALAASVLNDIGKIITRDASYKYADTYDYLSNNLLLDQLHWSPITESYADYGLHTDNVVLRRPKPSRPQPGKTLDKVRFTLKNPELRFVDTEFGYVSLFPFLLQILDTDSPKLGKVLNDLVKRELLWTDYGLRSLAKNSPLYLQYNTEHDPPYWRGPIWINLNFLTVNALHYYSTSEGPFRERAKDIGEKLKYNIIKNVIKNYNKTGFIWEQYDDKTGEGKGCKPFTGWSALVVLMMADHF